MKRFRFSLQALSTLRQRQENRALEAYGAALLQRQQALQQVQKADEDLQAAWHELQTTLQHGCHAAQAAHHRTLCSAIQERRQRALLQLQQAESSVQHTFNAMLEARRQREIVDKLEQRHRQHYQLELTRAENKLIDELALRRLPPALHWRTAH